MRFPPSRTAYIQLKDELQTIKDGKDILQQKRDILLREILNILNDVDSLRERLNQAVIKSYNLLVKAYMELGKDNVLKEANLSNFKGEVYVYQKTFMGIPVPEVKFRLKKVRFPVSTVSESVFIDVARQSFLDAVKLILELSRIEIKAWKLAEELKKTVIRVNALEKYYIPEYEKNIKMILFLFLNVIYYYRKKNKKKEGFTINLLSRKNQVVKSFFLLEIRRKYVKIKFQRSSDLTKNIKIH